MAVVFYDGAEGGTNATSGWLYRVPGASTGVSRRRRTADRDAGDRNYLPGGNTSTVNISTRKFPINQDEGRPLRLREAYLGVSHTVGEFRITGALLPFNQVGLSSPGWRRKCGYLLLAQSCVLFRATAVVAEVFGGTESLDFTRTSWFGVFVADVDGWMEVTDGRGLKTYARFDGDTAPGTGSELWVDSVYFTRTAAYSGFDDIVVLGPSIKVNIAGSPALPQDTLVRGLTSGAEAFVSDYEPSKGRIWLHSWDGTPWVDGETLEDGASNPIGTLQAPNSGYIDGFEPWSFPNKNHRGLPYVLASQPQTDVAPTELDPVGSAVNVENVNAIPESLASYNVNTSNVDREDSYSGYTALPGWVEGVFALSMDTYALEVAGGEEIQITMTDADGSQTVASLYDSDVERIPAVFPFRSDGSEWQMSEVPTLVVTYKLVR